MPHAFALIFSLLLTACATQHLPEIRLHTLEYAPPQFTAPFLPVTIRVARFAIVPELRTPALVLSQPYLRSDLPWDRWRALPSALATDFLRRDLVASQLFRAVVDAGAALPIDYQLEGIVEEWSEYREPGQRMARLGLTITLVDTHAPLAQAVLFQRRYDATEPCSAPHGLGLAQAMSQAMARLSAQIVRDTYEAIAARTR